MHKRVRMIRKENKLSQEEFGAILGVSRDVIGNIELDRLARPEQKDPIIKLICKEFGVNENWLKYGKGDKRINIERESQIMEFAQSIAMPGEESFKKEFLHILSQLDESDWETLEKITELMIARKS